jgi:hypothetical protein
MSGKKLSSDWVTTRQLASELNCSTRHVLRFIDNLPMKRGEHYINLNPSAMRPTYRFNVAKVRKLLESDK